MVTRLRVSILFQDYYITHPLCSRLGAHYRETYQIRNFATPRLTFTLRVSKYCVAWQNFRHCSPSAIAWISPLASSVRSRIALGALAVLGPGLAFDCKTRFYVVVG